MTDLDKRLADLGNSPADSPADAGADLERGHRALHRRRVRRSAGGMVLVLALAGTATYLGTAGNGTHHPSASTGAHTNGVGKQATGVRLVAYEGDQKPGFVIDRIPEGYVLNDSTGGYLDIAEPGDTSPGSDFRRKLVVSLQSVDVTAPPRGTAVTVNGQPGAISRSDLAASLDYTDGTHRILIQCWHNLGWSDDQLIAFAEGVTVTADVQESRG